MCSSDIHKALKEFRWSSEVFEAAWAPVWSYCFMYPYVCIRVTEKQQDPRKRVFPTSFGYCNPANKHFPGLRDCPAAVVILVQRYGALSYVELHGINQVLEIKPNYSLAFFGGATASACFNTSRTETSFYSQTFPSYQACNFKLKIQS